MTLFTIQELVNDFLIHSIFDGIIHNRKYKSHVNFSPRRLFGGNKIHIRNINNRLRLSIKIILVPDQRVTKIEASRAAAIFFFLTMKILSIFRFFFAKMKKKVSSRTLFCHPAGLPETELFLWTALIPPQLDDLSLFSRYSFMPSFMRLASWNVVMFVCYEQLKRAFTTTPKIPAIEIEAQRTRFA